MRGRVAPNAAHWALGCTLRGKPLWHRCFLAWKLCVPRRRRPERDDGRQVAREIVPITADTTFAEVRAMLRHTNEEDDEYFPYADDDGQLVGVLRRAALQVAPSKQSQSNYDH